MKMIKVMVIVLLFTACMAAVTSCSTIRTALSAPPSSAVELAQ